LVRKTRRRPSEGEVSVKTVGGMLSFGRCWRSGPCARLSKSTKPVATLFQRTTKVETAPTKATSLYRARRMPEESVVRSASSKRDEER